MSKISLQPNASGTGTFTLAAPDSNTNRTLTLPDEAGKILTDVSDIAADKLTGDIAADRMKDGFNASGSAPIYACRAWVNFNGDTVSIKGSGNVSSVTRNGAGDYTVNFTTAMPDANYSANVALAIPATFSSNTMSAGVRAASLSSTPDATTTSVRCFTQSSSGTRFDVSGLYVSIFR